MADFQFTQSGAQIQADLNLIENLQPAYGYGFVHHNRSTWVGSD